MKRFPFATLLLLTALTGCSTERSGISIHQNLVMDSAVLSAGILAEEPEISETAGQLRASSEVVNQQDVVVKVKYRFYWYDDKGLEIQPFEAPRTLVVPARGKLEITSQTGNMTASNVRLYLYL